MEDLILDAYKQFFEIIPKGKFFEFGLTNIIHIESNKVANEWSYLLQRIRDKDTELYVRNSGRNGTGNGLLTKLYHDVFKLNINYDQTNNSKPSMLIQRLTEKKKNETIFNYQVSHVFGRTKNVFCFTAPWNIVFIPRIVDPFTGHESKGDYVGEFRKLFEKKIYYIFESYIIEFNKLMKEYKPKIADWLDSSVEEKARKKYLKEFEEIKI